MIFQAKLENIGKIALLEKQCHCLNLLIETGFNVAATLDEDP